MAEKITVFDLEDGKVDIDTLEDIVNLQEPTTETRLSGPVKTWYGWQQDLQSQVNAVVSNVEDDAGVVLAGLGYLPPVAYAPGINVDNGRITVEYNGDVYAPLLSAIPFTTSGTFEASNFRLLAGVTASDLASDSGSGMIGFDGGTVVSVLDNAKPMDDYAELRAYSGRAVGVKLTDLEIAGTFQRDDSDAMTADNGGTVIIDDLGRRWKRVFDGPINAQWFCGLVDGVTSNQTGIAAAVATAKAIGAAIEWPALTFVSDANIPDFHSVVHFGNGVIKRGSDLYKITPNVTDTNTIYVASDGANTNDGLTPAFPIKTLSKIVSLLKNIGAESRGGFWVFHFAAGTYVDSQNFTNTPVFENSLKFEGEGTDRNPLTIFEGTGAAYQTAGMFFQNYMKVSLDKLKFQNFPNGYGAYAQWNCKLEITNCAADNCQNGFAAAYNSFLRIDKSSANNCTGAGARVTYNAQGDIGDGSGGSLANSFRATNCTNGVQVSRGSIAHVDYCELWDCDAGLTVDLGARAASLGSDFRRNGVGVRIWSSSEISLSPSQPLVYHQDEPSEANTKTIEYRGGGRDSALRGQAGSGEYRVFKDFVTSTVTGTVAATQVKGTLFTAEKGYMVDHDTRLRVVVTGQVTSSPTGTVQLSIRASTTAMAFISTPVGASGAFIAEFDINPTGPATQWGTSKISMQGQPCQVDVQSRSVDFATFDRPFSFWVDPNGDLPITVDVYKVEVFMLG